MISQSSKVAMLPMAGFTSLVDILLATMGIFIVVFAQLHLEDTPRMVPAAVDGLVLCDQDSVGPRFTLFAARAGGEVSLPVALPGLMAAILETWPKGARLWAALPPACAFGEAKNFLRDLDREIERLAVSGAPYLIEFAPLAASPSDTASGWEELVSRWRTDQAKAGYLSDPATYLLQDGLRAR